jgi:hypothetical protein
LNFLSDVISYVRRIIKSPSDTVITDNLIIDYINRFYINDVDARMQLFDLKTKYQFQTVPGVDKYNMPLYDVQTSGGQSISFYPVYQGFFGPAYINGIQVPLQTQKELFFGAWPNVVQYLNVAALGDGGAGPYNIQLPILPVTVPPNPPLSGILRGHVDISGIIATGNNVDPPVGTTLESIPVTSVDSQVFITSIGVDSAPVIVQDSGQFYANDQNYGLLMQPGNAPLGNSALTNNYVTYFPITAITQANPAVLTATTTLSVGEVVEIFGVLGMTELNGNEYTVTAVDATTVTLNVDSTGFTAYASGGTVSSLHNVINYFTGEIRNLFFPSSIPAGNNINVQCLFFQTGLPRGILFYNNVLTFRSPPSNQFLVELDAYLSPAAFLSSASAVPFGYMSEYIARGAARKILADTGDVEQFMFYEPLFKEQEMLVWKRSQRQFTSTRTETIYSRGLNYGSGNNIGGYL